MERNFEKKMEEHKIFKTAVIPVILLIIGIKHFTQSLLLSIIAGIGIYIAASFIDRFIKKR
jgi:hypothetical protein